MNIIVHESPFIDSIFHIPADMYRIERDYSFRGTPTLHEHIILNQDCAEIRLTIDGRQFVFNSNVVCGKFTHPPKINVVFKNTCKTLTVIRLSSYGMYKLTDIPIASMVNKITPGSTFSIDLSDDVANDRSVAWIEAMTDRPFDTKAYRITREIIHYVDENVTDLPSNITEAIAERFAISPSTLLRYFKKYIGMTPSTYILTLRRKQMIQTICRDEYNAQSVHESGYYDQSHFINDFKRLFGISLREYIDEMRQMKKKAPEMTRFLHNC